MPSFTALADILNHGLVWRVGELARTELPGISTGFEALDAELPGGGWPAGVLTELLPENIGIGEVRALGPALASLSRRQLWVLWIAPPFLPYAPALEAAGIDLAHVLIVRTKSPQESLWAFEQALQSGACGAVLGWPEKPTFAQLRRLQIAAEGSSALAFLFRPPQAARESSPAALRLHLQSLQGELAVRLLKRRGGPLAKPIRLKPAPVIDKPAGFAESIEHAVDRALPSAPAARILPARIGHG